MSTHMYNSQLPRRSSRSSGTLPSRSSRVEKPKSHHNSPRTMERRKTTTEPKLYATLDDHYKMMFGIEDSEEEVDERPQPSRPVSWHPSSNQWAAPRLSGYVASPSQQEWSWHAPSRNSGHGSDFYSLSTRNSTYESNVDHQTYSTGCGAHRGSDESDYSWQSVPNQIQSYAHSALNTPSAEPLPWYLQQWAQKNQVIDSQNGSAEFLPIQHPSDYDEHMITEDGGKELVGMGLYDAPDPTSTWGGHEEATGKGLKLEETWQPPEADDEDDEDDEEDDASSEGSMDEPSPPLPVAGSQTQQLQLPVHVKSQTPGSMEGQSFFFDDDETVSKEWWFQQLKQPNMPVQDAGLGYGWLR
ncbi:hypothetical protein C7974DRAFT_96728 [Boeremia exigua]|uniref:uncharacterized protein n=1 Tax=Boeremia exigua TaxID=749465 RepID=UPI001E8DFA65|nr:uncharacterized protein C7974DRAFT_96728 [Boeremia exigua]KAH6642177.1 hypothetical protein C7974DRAFT_96728 [Boeremia exigua]